MYDIILRYEDGRRTTAQHQFDDLSEACSRVLALADRFGVEASHGSEAPKWVEIYKNDHLEISVSVVRGGLTESKAPIASN